MSDTEHEKMQDTHEIFNFNWDIQGDLIEESLTNPQKLQAHLDALRKSESDARAAGLTQSEFDQMSSRGRVSPMASDKYFPGNYIFVPFGLELSHESSTSFEHFINNAPEQLMRLHLPAFRTEEYKSGDDAMAAKARFFDETLAPYLKNELGFTEDNLSYIDLVTIYEILSTAKQSTVEAVYFHHTLQEAAELISTLAPSLREIVMAVVKDIVLLRPSQAPQKAPTSQLGQVATAQPHIGPVKVRRKQELMPSEELNYLEEKFGNMLTDVRVAKSMGKNLILIPTVAPEKIRESHALSTLVIAHELLHAVADTLINVSPDGEGNRIVDLYQVIMEGISVAMEYTLLKEINKNTTDSIAKEQLNMFGEFRVQSVKGSNRIWVPTLRLTDVANAIKKKSETERVGMLEVLTHLMTASDTANLGGFKYSEGVLLAIALRRKGWSLDQLPQLCAKIRDVLAEELGVQDVGIEDFAGVVARKNKTAELFSDAVQAPVEVFVHALKKSPIFRKALDGTHVTPHITRQRLERNIRNTKKPGTEYTRIFAKIRQLEPEK